MLSQVLRKYANLQEMKRYPNKPFPAKTDVEQHSFEVGVYSQSLANWEQYKFGNEINWEKLMKASLAHDLAEADSGDLLPILKNINRALFDMVERELVEANLIPDFPDSWQEEYREYILNPKSDSIEGTIIAASDRLAGVQELTKMLNFLNPNREIFRDVVSIIQETLLSLMSIELQSCQYFLKYVLPDWDLQEFYPEDFSKYVNSLVFTKAHFENEYNIKKKN